VGILVQTAMPRSNNHQIDAFLKSLDLARTRTPGELANLEEKIERKFAASPEFKQESGRGSLEKKYVEEIRPLGLLAGKLFPDRDDVTCTPLLDSGGRDAVINYPCGAGQATLYVEFTNATDGHKEHLRMKVLREKGRVNLLTQVRSSGTEKRGHKIEVPDGLVHRQSMLEKHANLIIRSIKRKCGKRYGRDDHILAVIFDDYVSFRSDEEFKFLRSSIDSRVELLTLDFRNVYMLGRMFGTLEEVPLPKNPRGA
jgi:hypothetical protein